MSLLNSADDYIALGVDPPTSEQHEIVGDPLNNHIHDWRQRGTEIMCEMGSNPHGRNVPADHLLTGTTKEGVPIFKIIDISTTK